MDSLHSDKTGIGKTGISKTGISKTGIGKTGIGKTEIGKTVLRLDEFLGIAIFWIIIPFSRKQFDLFN